MSKEEKTTARQEQAAQTKRKLLDSARVLFAENGYAGTPVRSINRAVGLADGLLYHYFPGGKQEVFQVLVTEDIRHILEDIQRRSQILELQNASVEEVLETMYQNFCEILREHMDIFKIIFKENEVRKFVPKEELAAMAQPQLNWFPQFLEKRAQAGEILPMDYVCASGVFMSFVVNQLMLNLLDLGPGPMENPQIRQRFIAYQVGLWKK